MKEKKKDIRNIKFLNYMAAFFDVNARPIKEVLFNVIVICGMLGGVVSIVLSVINDAPVLQSATSVIAELMLVECFHLANFRKNKYDVASVIIVFFVTAVLFPIIFFTGGGVHGGGAIWYLIGIVFTFLLLSGKEFVILLIGEMIIYSLSFVVAYYYPQFVIPLDSELDIYLDMLQSLVIVALAVGIIIKFQVRLFDKQLHKIESQNEELYKMQQVADIARAEAIEANQSKSRFLANMSHEIRTPINSVLGMNEMILRESSEDSVKKYAKDIKSSANSLLSIINDILDFSKIESGKMEIIPQEYEMGSLINDLYNMIRQRAEEKALAVEVRVQPDIPAILYGDDIRIRQILINILNNAVKYTPSGTISLIIEGEKQGGEVLLKCRVKDTGIGIKEDELPKLFAAFERIEESRNRSIEGTGLGMSITANLLNLMGSKLCVESEYGVGSTFFFELRQQIVSPEPIGDFRKRAMQAAEEYSYNSLFTAPEARILVVDDNDINRHVFKSLLKETKIKIDDVDSGMKCLDLVKAKHYDIIFLDHMMPEMDGIETLYRMRMQEENLCRSTPMVMLTANAIVGAKENYLAMGFNEFLSKPIIPEKLENIVMNLLPKELVVQENSAYKTEERVEFKEISSDEDISDINTPEDAQTERDILPDIDEINWAYAKMYIPDKELLRETAYNFYKSIEKERSDIEELFKNIDNPEVMSQYRIRIHGLKSVASAIGALLLFGTARILEMAAKEGDKDKIKALHPIFIEELYKHESRLSVLEKEQSDKQTVEPYVLMPLIDMMRDALKERDFDTADLLIEQIDMYDVGGACQKKIEQLKAQVRGLEADNAINTIGILEAIIAG